MSSSGATSHLHKPVKVLNNMSLYYSGDVAVIVIDRGENRLNPEFCHTMLELLDDVEQNASCKGLITTGQGKFYGNGLDLELLSRISIEENFKFTHAFFLLMRRITFFPIPTLAALNGHSFAGGALIALCHDLRTMRNDKGWFCLNEVFISRMFAKSHFPLFRLKLGLGRNYTDAVVMGKRFTGREAFNYGLVHAMPSENLLIIESIRLLKSFYGKSGYPRESLTDMKAEVYADYKKAVNEDIEGIEENLQKTGGDEKMDFWEKETKSKL